MRNNKVYESENRPGPSVPRKRMGTKSMVVPFVLLAGLLGACGDDGQADAAAPAVGADSSFCAIAADIDARFTSLDETSSPEALRDAADDVDGLLDQAVEAAPPELVDDVAAVAAAQRIMFDRVAALDYDLETFWATLEEDESIQIPGEAEARVDLYLSDICGIDLD